MFEDLDHERAGFRVMGTPLAELSRDDLERALVFAALRNRSLLEEAIRSFDKRGIWL